MKKYIPAIAIAAIIAASVPFMRSAKAEQSLAERINAINSARITQSASEHWVVVLSGEGAYQETAYPVGFVVSTSSSSPGAPKFKRGDDLASSLATLKDQGATITIHAWGSLTYTAIR